jgi:hypothetical protein
MKPPLLPGTGVSCHWPRHFSKAGGDAAGRVEEGLS